MGAGEKGHLFSLAIILMVLGSKHILLEFLEALKKSKGKIIHGFWEIRALFLELREHRPSY